MTTCVNQAMYYYLVLTVIGQLSWMWVGIALVTVQNWFITYMRTTPHTFSRRIHFRIIHNKIMSNGKPYIKQY